MNLGIGNKNFLIRTLVYKRSNTYAKIYANDTLDYTEFEIINGMEITKIFLNFLEKRSTHEILRDQGFHSDHGKETDLIKIASQKHSYKIF